LNDRARGQQFQILNSHLKFEIADIHSAAPDFQPLTPVYARRGAMLKSLLMKWLGPSQKAVKDI
jgi:hypothetical protein